MNVAQKNNRSVRSRYESNVTVECLSCGHTAVLTREALCLKLLTQILPKRRGFHFCDQRDATGNRKRDFGFSIRGQRLQPGNSLGRPWPALVHNRGVT